MFGSDRDGRRAARDRAAVVADLRRRLGALGGQAPGLFSPGGDGASQERSTGGDGDPGQRPIGGDGASGQRPIGGDGTPEQRPIGGDGASGPVPLADPARTPGPPASGVGPPPGSSPASGILPVPAPLAEALPRGGIARGSVVSLSSSAPGRSGTTSLLLSLLAAPPGIWTAVVGMPGLGVLAAAELGVDLDRLALIPDPGPDVMQVLSVLADGVDVIATVPPADLPPARERVLTGRLRQRGAVLLVVGRWPGADLTLTVREVRWSGTGQGHGRLRDREMDVLVGGRRSGGDRTATLLLRSTRTSVTVEPGTRTSADAPRHAAAAAG